MPKVTYLLGAGASAKVLPVVSDIPVQLNLFRQVFQTNQWPEDEKLDFAPGSLKAAQQQFLAALEYLIENVPKHASIDTYAKKLLITDQTVKYKSLKGVFSCFLTYLQLINEPDPRYDSFLASVLGEFHNDFMHEVKIISWNYDFQLEKAYSQYSGDDTIQSSQSMLNVRFLNSRNKAIPRDDEFALFKFEWHCGFH